MKILMMFGILAAGLAIDADVSRADAAPWCAWYNATASDCGYFTHQQCLDTIRGVGGWCSLNVYEFNAYEYGEPYGPPPRRHRHAKHRDWY
jgi:hypothetical protein